MSGRDAGPGGAVPGPPHGPPGPGVPPYGAGPAWGPPAQAHPDARLAMILGVVGLGGFVFCLLPIVVSPVAWAKGARAVREIDASGGRLAGRDDAHLGMVLGIIGTVVLGLVLLVIVVTVVVLGVLTATMVTIFEETSTNV